jgi:hypothetical protein
MNRMVLSPFGLRPGSKLPKDFDRLSWALLTRRMTGSGIDSMDGLKDQEEALKP